MRQIFKVALVCLVVTNTFADELLGTASPAANDKQLATAKTRIATAVAASSIASPGRVVVVYFTPRDRKPAANHIERIRRIVEETAGFYERELNRHGFHDRRMNVLRNEDGQVDLIDVVGADSDKDYGKPDGSKIRNEVIPVLRAKGIDPETAVLLLFCNLMDYDPKQSKISHHSPYYGGGSHLTGTAWQCDSEILDPQRFRDATPLLDGEYGRITIGRHNSIFIGGVIHELGHALSLPHSRERTDEAVRGTALMGSGNRTYAQELRGEGLGTFLTQGDALRLAAHPVFNKQVVSTLYDHPKTEWPELVIDVAESNTIRIRGTVTSDIPIHAVITYFDPAGGSDYDATTAAAIPNEDGRFAVRSGELQPGLAGELRLVACHVNGDTTTRELTYRVDKNGQPDLSALRLELELSPMLDALRKQGLQAASDKLEQLSKSDESLKAIGQRVLDRFGSPTVPASINPAAIPATTKSIMLSRLKPQSASVGWVRPTYDGVPSDEKLLSIDGDCFASGIYAHAPAKHQYPLGKQWQRLSGRCGLQSGHGGKVDFEIIGDKRSLWNSRGVTIGEGSRFDIDITGIEDLTLIVTDGGDGTNADWGVWIEPTLKR